MRSLVLRGGLIAVTVLTLMSLHHPSRPALAAHHVAEISEIMSGFNQNPSVQYVEINQRAAGQNVVGGSLLSAFDATGGFVGILLQVPSNVPNTGNGVKWIIGTTAFETAAGIQADFEFYGGIPPAAGMVCVGAPGVYPTSPPPGMWDATNPNNYVDCVAYGSYSGTTPNIPAAPNGPTNTPTTLPAGDCQQSLSRINATTFLSPDPPNGTWADTESSLDFALAAPSPTNNAGNVGTLAAKDLDGDAMANCRDTDDDNDTLLDGSDNCPRTLGGNTDQTDGDGDLAGVPCDPNDTVVDFDGDGCADGEEFGPNQMMGGRRNPTNAYDFYDTDGNKVINITDIIAVASVFGPAPGPPYLAAYDRSNPPAPGKNPADKNNMEPWDLGPPDNAINVFTDILGVAGQFAHTCAAAP